MEKSEGLSRSDATSDLSRAAAYRSPALAAAVSIAAGTSAYGALQLTDVPDIIVSNATVGIDLDNNATIDFNLTHNIGPTNAYTSTPTTQPYFVYTRTGNLNATGNQPGAQVVRAAGPISKASVLYSSDSVSSANSFGNGKQSNMASYSYRRKATTSSLNTVSSNATWNGDWVSSAGSNSQAFLGFRFPIVTGMTTNFHYGFAHIHVNPTNAVTTLLDYGYEDTAGAAAHVQAIPEANTLLGMAAGAAAILVYRRRKKSS